MLAARLKKTFFADEEPRIFDKHIMTEILSEGYQDDSSAFHYANEIASALE